MTARTRGRIARLAAEQGWADWSTDPKGLFLRRGDVSVNLRFGKSGQLIQAIRSEPGESQVVKKGRMAFVVGWLTEEVKVPRCQKGGPDPCPECAR